MLTISEKEQYYIRTIEIWSSLCDLHKDLFDLTANEYMNLLSGEVDPLEELIDKKNELVNKISSLEKKRIKLINEIKSKMVNDNKFEINSFSRLFNLFSEVKVEKESQHLKKFNLILIELIGKIQEQNKKNQLFINKAIISLDKIKNAGNGNKNYSLYNKQGALAERS